MSNSIELTVDGTTLLGGAVGAVIATLWSTTPIFLSGPGVAAITSNQTLLILLGVAVMVGTLLYQSDFENGIAIPRTSLYTGISAFLLVGTIGYAALPVASVIQGEGTPTGELTGDNLRKATLKVDGMVCQGCKMTVQSYLSSMDGVKQIKADLSKKQVTVIYDGDATGADMLADADVFKGAYSATVQNDEVYRG